MLTPLHWQTQQGGIVHRLAFRQSLWHIYKRSLRQALSRPIERNCRSQNFARSEPSRNNRLQAFFEDRRRDGEGNLQAVIFQRNFLIPESRCRKASYFLAYQSALTGVKLCHFSGRSSRAKMAVTGQTGMQAPQSMHSVGLM